MMVSFNTASLVVFFLAGAARASEISRRLSYEFIAGYEPRSQVTDHAAIDLDMQEIKVQLALGTDLSEKQAQLIYENGAFSKSVAQITLGTPLTFPIDKGAQVTGAGLSGEIRGKILEDYPAGSEVITVQYQTSPVQSVYSRCQVGANPSPVLVGCLNGTGTIAVEGLATPLSYQYDPLLHNSNDRTLQKFSTDAQALMYDCSSANCPYVTYEKFYDYYGAYDYADQWVTAAFLGESTNFVNGNADFSSYTIVGRTEAIQKGIAYMNVYMYVIREMEDALDDCVSECELEDCNNDPVHAWDEAVAFYTGSLEGQDGSGSGNLMYDLADKRCINFNTCGDLAASDEGTAHVNLEIFRQFEDGLRKIRTGQCVSARTNKERIEQLMAVPLIQGTLRYAYIKEYFEKADMEQANAEGATFAAAVLPLVHHCNENDAYEIYEQMKTGQDFASFRAVKGAFERNYACMNIRCKDVGGIFAPANGGYMKWAEPCSSSNRLGIQIAFVVTAAFAVISMIF